MQFLQHRIRLPRALTIAAICLVTAACTTVETQSFRVTDSPNVETVYLATDADFKKYDRLTAGEMGIYFQEEFAPSEDDQQRTRQIFRSAFLGELGDYSIVDKAGSSTLMVQATLVDFRRASYVDASTVRRELRDIVKPGAILFLMELKDSKSGKVLARAVDSASAPVFSSSTSGTDWTSVESAAARWAALFRQFLDDNLNN